MYKKIRKIIMLILTAGSLCGTALLTQAEEELWSYTESLDEDGNLVYEFAEVQVTLPADWEGKFTIEELEDGVCFSHTALRDALPAENPPAESSEIFSIHASENYEFVEEPRYIYEIGRGESAIYYLSKMQGYPADGSPEKVQEEWRQLSDDREWIEEHMTIAVSNDRMYATVTVNIRNRATTSSAIMGIVPEGYGVTVTDEVTGEWVPVEYNGIRGFIRADYLTIKGEEPAQTETEQPDVSNPSVQNGGTEMPSMNPETEGITGQTEAPLMNPETGETAMESEVLTEGFTLYPGHYRDSRLFTVDIDVFGYREVQVLSVTDTTFDYSINIMDDGVLRQVLATGTATFVNGRTEAVSEVDGIPIYFSFPNYHYSHPVIVDMVVSGYPELEGLVLAENCVPGHEFS